MHFVIRLPPSVENYLCLEQLDKAHDPLVRQVQPAPCLSAYLFLVREMLGKDASVCAKIYQDDQRRDGANRGQFFA
jgi:hypothetical protein